VVGGGFFWFFFVVCFLGVLVICTSFSVPFGFFFFPLMCRFFWCSIFFNIAARWGWCNVGVGFEGCGGFFYVVYNISVIYSIFLQSFLVLEE